MGTRLIERINAVSGIIPVDLQTGANDGDWVSLKNYGKVACVLFKAAGTAGDDPTLTMEQASAVDGTGAKALTFTTIFKKQDTALTSVGAWTKVTQTAAATYTDATSAEDQAIWWVEFNAEDLDVDNGFDCVRMRVADIGANAQIGCGIYLLADPAYGDETLESAIDD